MKSVHASNEQTAVFLLELNRGIEPCGQTPRPFPVALAAHKQTERQGGGGTLPGSPGSAVVR